jgi:hypothetical protein
MFIVTAVLSVLLAVALAGSAYAKLTKDPKIVESLVGTVGVPEDRLWMLAALELAGAAGLLIGLFWAPLGIAAAVGVVLYFIGAVGGHVRVGDTSPAALAPAGVILLVAVAVLVLRVATA